MLRIPVTDREEGGGVAETDRWAQIRERALRTPDLQARYEHRRRTVISTRKLLMRIDAERERAGLTKAELARRIGTAPSVVRRLFAAEAGNPTLHTVLDVVEALGMEIEFRSVGETNRRRASGSRRNTAKDRAGV